MRPVPSQAKASHTMPVFPLGEEGFDSDRAFAKSLLVSFGLVVTSHPIQILLIHTAAERASLCTGGTLGFERTVIAVFGAGMRAQRTLSRVRSIQMQFFACWTQVDITLRVIAEAIRAKELRAVLVLRKRYIRAHVLGFKGTTVLCGPVCAINRDLPRTQFPAKAGAEDADPRMGWFSMTSEGATNASRIMRALPPSTT